MRFPVKLVVAIVPPRDNIPPDNCNTDPTGGLTTFPTKRFPEGNKGAARALWKCRDVMVETQASVLQLAFASLYIGITGYGGGPAIIALMHRYFIDRRR
jgi:hypothetical protein